MSFLWVILGPIQKIPLDLGERTIFVDIMMNDQTDVGLISQELDKAEGHYRDAEHHVILGSKGVLARAWCLYEIAIRREARKRSQLLFVRGSDGSDLAIEPVKASEVGIIGVLACILMRISTFLCGTFFISILNYKFSLGSDMIIKDLENTSSESVEVASGQVFSYFEDMEAFKDSDKEGIRNKIKDVFGTISAFNCVVGAATVQANSSRLAFCLLLWMESFIFCMMIPIHIASFAFGVALGLSSISILRICCICSKHAHKQYFTSDSNANGERKSEIQIFLTKICMFCLYFETFVCVCVCAVFMILPVLMILCATWLCSCINDSTSRIIPQ